MKKEEIQNLFKDQEKDILKDVSKKIREIYREIEKRLDNTSLEILTKKIIIEEASKVNSYIQELDRQLQEKICETMSDKDILKNSTNIVWIRVKQKVGVPKICLCQEEDVSDEFDTSLQKDNKKSNGLVVIIAGVCMEVIGCFFIPAIGKWAITVNGLGIILVAAGIYKKFKEKFQITVNSDVRSEGEQVKVICETQRDLNTKIIHEWVNKIYDTLIEEIYKEIQE